MSIYTLLQANIDSYQQNLILYGFKVRFNPLTGRTASRQSSVFASKVKSVVFTFVKIAKTVFRMKKSNRPVFLFELV